MVGLIIFGTQAVRRKRGTGSFFCPSCRRDTTFVRSRVRQFFTLYFVPLIPLGKGTEIVHCEGCGLEYPADVLVFGHDAAASAVGPWTCGSCGNANPPECDRCVACGWRTDP